MFEGNAHTMDCIAMLHTVGSAIAPLVYEMTKEVGFREFLEAFEPVWKAVEKDPNLSNSFVSNYVFLKINAYVFSYCNVIVLKVLLQSMLSTITGLV